MLFQLDLTTTLSASGHQTVLFEAPDAETARDWSRRFVSHLNEALPGTIKLAETRPVAPGGFNDVSMAFDTDIGPVVWRYRPGYSPEPGCRADGAKRGTEGGIPDPAIEGRPASAGGG